MTRPRKKPVYLVVEAAIIGAIGKDRILVLDTDPAGNLMEELECPRFDELLIALRKAFSLTFRTNPFMDGPHEALEEIRRIGVDALRTIPEVLEELHLKSVPPLNSDDRDSKVVLFHYCMARSADLQLNVKFNGKTRKLVDLVDGRPADEVVRVLREVVSNTFEEMHGIGQQEAVLRRIRHRIGSLLPAFNDLLAKIEIEPIADLSLLSESAAKNSSGADSEVDLIP